MAGQICVDIGYVDKSLFDENELAPAGPGCVKGLNFLYNDVDMNPGNANDKHVQALLRNIRDKQEVQCNHSQGFKQINPAPF